MQKGRSIFFARDLALKVRFAELSFSHHPAILIRTAKKFKLGHIARN